MINILQWAACIADILAISTKSFPKYILASCIFGLIGACLFIVYGTLTEQYGIVILNIVTVIFSAIGTRNWLKQR